MVLERHLQYYRSAQIFQLTLRCISHETFLLLLSELAPLLGCVSVAELVIVASRESYPKFIGNQTETSVRVTASCVAHGHGDNGLQKEMAVLSRVRTLRSVSVMLILCRIYSASLLIPQLESDGLGGEPSTCF